jgi:hypothetical protein
VNVTRSLALLGAVLLLVASGGCRLLFGVPVPCADLDDCLSTQVCVVSPDDGNICADPTSTLPRAFADNDGGTPGGDGGADAGADAGALADGGPLDGGSLDSGSLDGGSLDGGSLDSGSLDGGALDGGALDSGPIDSGPIDGGVLDAGFDAGPCPGGCDGGFCFSNTCVQCLQVSDCNPTACAPKSCNNNQCEEAAAVCSGGTPVCRELSDGGPTCVECLDDPDCSTGRCFKPAAGGDYTCEECFSTPHCDGGFCDLNTNTCGACSLPEHCATPCAPGSACASGSCTDAPKCTGAESICVGDGGCIECLVDNDCTSVSGKPRCEDQMSNACVACLVAEDCPTGAFCDGDRVCDSANACAFSGDPCTADPALDVCDEDNTRCVECLTSADCDGTDKCQAATGTCHECLIDATCGDTEVFRCSASLTCEAIAPPTDALWAHFLFPSVVNQAPTGAVDGTVGDAVTQVADRFGSANAAFHFGPTGSNGGVSVGLLSPPGDQERQAGTWSFWMRALVGSTPGNAPILENGSGNDRLIEVRLAGGIIDFTLYAEAGLIPIGNLINGGSSLIDDEWHHIALTFEGQGYMNLYIDGVFSANDGFSGSMLNDASPQTGTIGYDYNVNTSMQGELDQYRYYTRQLTAAEVKRLYHEGNYDLP